MSEMQRLRRTKDALHPGHKTMRVKFGAKDFVGAVRHNGNPPVTDERYKLALVRGSHLAAHLLGVRHTVLTLYVDQDEIVGPCPEQCEALLRREGGVDVEAGQPQNLVPQRP